MNEARLDRLRRELANIGIAVEEIISILDSYEVFLPDDWRIWVDKHGFTLYQETPAQRSGSVSSGSAEEIVLEFKSRSQRAFDKQFLKDLEAELTSSKEQV